MRSTALDRPNAFDSDRLFRFAFYLFAASIAFSVAGTLVLKLVPASYALFGPYLGWLIRIPTWVYMAMLPLLSFLLYLRPLGMRRSVLFFLWGSAVGAAAELIGTQTGLPFGPYHYTDWLGPKIAGHVPWFIPPSWYAMAILSYDMARRLRMSGAATVVTAALFMVLWDVALDPAMNRAFPFWVYPDGGFFFGMPLINWFGWMVTSLVIMAGFHTFLGGLNHEAPWAPLLWGLNALFPILISLLYDLPLAAAIGLIALAIPMVLLRQRGALMPRDLDRSERALQA
jgi:carotene biosynthesis associated membrane protein